MSSAIASGRVVRPSRPSQSAGLGESSRALATSRQVYGRLHPHPPAIRNTQLEPRTLTPKRALGLAQGSSNGWRAQPTSKLIKNAERTLSFRRILTAAKTRMRTHGQKKSVPRPIQTLTKMCGPSYGGGCIGKTNSVTKQVRIP